MRGLWFLLTMSSQAMPIISFSVLKQYLQYALYTLYHYSWIYPGSYLASSICACWTQNPSYHVMPPMSCDVSLNFHKIDANLQKFYSKNSVFKIEFYTKFSTTKIWSHTVSSKSQYLLLYYYWWKGHTLKFIHQEVIFKIVSLKHFQLCDALLGM